MLKQKWYFFTPSWIVASCSGGLADLGCVKTLMFGLLIQPLLLECSYIRDRLALQLLQTAHSLVILCSRAFDVMSFLSVCDVMTRSLVSSAPSFTDRGSSM